MSSNSSFSNQDGLLAQSLDVSADIYKIPAVKQLSVKAAGSCQTNSSESVQPVSNEDSSIANIMNSAGAVKCPCCANESENEIESISDSMLKQNPIFVEQREGTDPVFLDENEVQPYTDEVLEENDSDKEDKPNPEDIITSQILELIKNDNFDPSQFII